MAAKRSFKKMENSSDTEGDLHLEDIDDKGTVSKYIIEYFMLSFFQVKRNTTELVIRMMMNTTLFVNDPALPNEILSVLSLV